MKAILVTGGAGFIGSNFIPYFLEKHSNYFVVNLDLLTYAGNLENLKEVENHSRYKFIKGDICNRDLLEFIFSEYDIRAVIHFAAESHVDNSINRPADFIRTNIVGTFTLLDVAYRYWMKEPFVFRKGYETTRFHHISTDEVYGSIIGGGFFTEETPYAPNSPYSASKASADMLVRAYRNTYGLNTIISICSNNYGPKQHDEKLIPTIIRNALSGNPIPIYGDGENIRDWIYVMDHCEAIDLLFHFGKSGESYNIGARCEKTNNQVVNYICELLDLLKPRKDGMSYKHQISYVKDRPGHDRRYAIDPTKIEKELNWKPKESFESGILKTIKWYLENRNWGSSY